MKQVELPSQQPAPIIGQEARPPSTTPYNVASFAAENANQSAASRAQDYTKGFETARGLLKDDGSFNKSLGFGNDAMIGAIRQKYRGEYGMKERRIGQNLRQSAEQDYLKRLAIASEMAGQEHELNMQKEILRQKKAAAKRAARGQIIGTVLGIAGGVAGGVLGSAAGPTGTAAGISAGSQLGMGVGGVLGEGM